MFELPNIINFEGNWGKESPPFPVLPALLGYTHVHTLVIKLSTISLVTRQMMVCAGAHQHEQQQPNTWTLFNLDVG